MKKRHTGFWLGLPALVLSCATLSAPCEHAITPISEVQGDAMHSPLVGESLTVRGIVTASWQPPKQLGGFFLHSLPDDIDDDPNTSEGVFIAADQADFPTLSVGDTVSVSGTVDERSELTSLVNVTDITSCKLSYDTPQTTTVRLPVASLDVLESLEGMPVQLLPAEGQSLTISGHYNYPRYGFFDVSSGRLWTPTQIAQPGHNALQQADENTRNRLQVDDNSRVVEPRPLPFAPLQGTQNRLRSGSTLEPFTGIISQFHAGYRIQPTQPLTLKSEAPVSALADKQNDTLRIASFNVLNFFNGNGAGAGFPTPRGADTPEQMQRQLKKIIAALSTINADVIGLMELENDGFDDSSAIHQLTQALENVSGKTYAIVEPRAHKVGTDHITVGMIYQPERVKAVSHAIFTQDGPFSWGSRPPLAQRFVDKHSGEAFSVVVNHFKSKGSCPENADNPNSNQHDGQACWNHLRVKSSKQLVQWIQEQSLDNAVLLGDFNAYYHEDPVHYLREHGFYNPSGATDYSFVYDSQAGALDHVFVADAFKDRIQAVHHLPYNADESWLYDYRDDAYFAVSPFRSSDHDPLVLDLRLPASGE